MSPISGALARQIKPEKRDAAVVAQNAEAATKVWTYLDHFMGDGPFAVGSEPTLGDCALGPHMVMFKVLVFPNFADIPDPTKQGGRIQTWWDAMQGNDTCRTLLDDYAVAFDKMMAYFR